MFFIVHFEVFLWDWLFWRLWGWLYELKLGEFADFGMKSIGGDFGANCVLHCHFWCFPWDWLLGGLWGWVCVIKVAEFADSGWNYWCWRSLCDVGIFLFFCVCVVILCSFALLIYFWCVLICCFWFWVRWNWLRVWSRSWVWRLTVAEFADVEWIGCCLLDVRVNYVLLLKGQFLFLLEVSALNLSIWKEMIGVS